MGSVCAFAQHQTVVVVEDVWITGFQVVGEIVNEVWPGFEIGGGVIGVGKDGEGVIGEEGEDGGELGVSDGVVERGLALVGVVEVGEGVGLGGFVGGAPSARLEGDEFQGVVGIDGAVEARGEDGLEHMAETVACKWGDGHKPPPLRWEG
jgi:hypothetical protein